MKAAQFRHVLIDTCLLTSAVDGHVAEAELAVIREVLAKSFVGDDAIVDRLAELDKAAVRCRDDVEKYRSACLGELGTARLTEGQSARLLDLCCRVIEADGMFDPAEVELLRMVLSACDITVHDARRICPEHVGVLSMLDREDNRSAS